MTGLSAFIRPWPVSASLNVTSKWKKKEEEEGQEDKQEEEEKKKKKK